MIRYKSTCPYPPAPEVQSLGEDRMKTPEQLGREIDLVHKGISEAGVPSGTDDMLLIVGQSLAAILDQMIRLNRTLDEISSQLRDR